MTRRHFLKAGGMLMPLLPFSALAQVGDGVDLPFLSQQATSGCPGAPVLSNIACSTATGTMIVTWNTNQVTNSNIVAYSTNFGVDPQFLVNAPDGGTSHSATLFGLTPNTTWFYKVLSSSICDGSTTQSGISSCVTTAFGVVQTSKVFSGIGDNVEWFLAQSPAAGNLMVFCAASQGADISSVSDSVNGTTGWTRITGSNNASIFCSIWYKKNLPGGITGISVQAVGGTHITGAFCEVIGASTTAPFTGGEVATLAATTTTNPVVGPLTNGTAKSIFFACLTDTDSANPALLGINGANSVGTWALPDATNSQDLNGSANQVISVPTIIVSSSTAEKCGWTTNSKTCVAALACFHI